MTHFTSRIVTRSVVVCLVASATLVFSGVATAAEDPKTPMSPDLISRADATLLAEAALEACAARGMPASVLVTDSAGHVRVALSDDHAKLVGMISGRAKVNAVVDFKTSTRELQARVAADKDFAARYGSDERYRFSPGGLPIYRAGKFVAVIAVGGAHSIDEECALAAIRRLTWASTAAGAHDTSASPSNAQ